MSATGRERSSIRDREADFTRLPGPSRTGIQHGPLRPTVRCLIQRPDGIANAFVTGASQPARGIAPASDSDVATCQTEAMCPNDQINPRSAPVSIALPGVPSTRRESNGVQFAPIQNDGSDVNDFNTISGCPHIEPKQLDSLHPVFFESNPQTSRARPRPFTPERRSQTPSH